MDPNIHPATNFTAVTPSDSANFAQAARAIYVGGAGDVVLINGAGTAVKFASVPAGTILPCFTTRVNSTNTTATSIIALF